MPSGSASAGLGWPSSSQRSRKCCWQAARSLSVDALPLGDELLRGHRGVSKAAAGLAAYYLRNHLKTLLKNHERHESHEKRQLHFILFVCFVSFVVFLRFEAGSKAGPQS